MNYSDVQALANLFGSYRAAEEEDKDWSESEVEAVNPGHIGPQYSKNAKGGEEDQKKENEKKEKPEIDLEKEEAKHGRGRIPPEYEFVYKQAVSCSDVYMQMSEKDCSSLCCEDLVMRIKLPGTDELEDIDLDVGKTYVKVIAPQYYLGLFLPHKVEKEKSSAKWDPANSTLIVTMPIIERDWVRNFYWPQQQALIAIANMS